MTWKGGPRDRPASMPAEGAGSERRRQADAQEFVGPKADARGGNYFAGEIYATSGATRRTANDLTKKVFGGPLKAWMPVSKCSCCDVGD